MVVGFAVRDVRVAIYAALLAGRACHGWGAGFRLMTTGFGGSMTRRLVKYGSLSRPK
jgi:hypothetical protein